MTITKNEKTKAWAFGRKRKWSPEQKNLIIEETYDPEMSVSYVAKKLGIAPSLLFSWRRHMEEGAIVGLDHEERVFPEAEIKKLQNKVKELERILGKKTLENEILKEAVKIEREKKSYRGLPCSWREISGKGNSNMLKSFSFKYNGTFIPIPNDFSGADRVKFVS